MAHELTAAGSDVRAGSCADHDRRTREEARRAHLLACRAAPPPRRGADRQMAGTGRFGPPKELTHSLWSANTGRVLVAQPPFLHCSLLVSTTGAAKV